MDEEYETMADVKDALIDALRENVELGHKLRAALEESAEGQEVGDERLHSTMQSVTRQAE